MQIKVIGSGSSGNCYLIGDGKTNILLDCGLPIRLIKEKSNFVHISACLITHCHMDHCKSMYHLLQRGIDCYVAEAELQLLDSMAAHNIRSHHRFKPITYEEIKVGTFNVVPFKVMHDTPEPVGYLLYSTATGEKLVYFTDTYSVPYTFKGLNYIIGECNYTSEELWEHIDEGSTHTGRAKRLFRSHMSLDNFLRFLEQNLDPRLKQIYICHMSDDHGDEVRIKEEVQKATGVDVIIC